MWFRSRGIWVVQYDTDYMVALCFDCHQTKPYAPHVNESLFMDKISSRIAQDDLDRYYKLTKFLNSPETSEEAKRSYEEPPCFAEIAAGLTIQLKHTMLEYELQMYNYDPPYRGRAE